MIWGRPVNLWAGLATALVGAIGVTAIALGADPTLVASLGSAWGLVVGAGIAVIAGQPPTLAPGSEITVQTPSGQPNATATVGLEPSQVAGGKAEVTVSQ